MKPFGIKLRSATDRDAEGVARLVDAAYEHYTARIGRKPMPMTLDYGDEIRRKEATVAESSTCAGSLRSYAGAANCPDSSTGGAPDL